MIDHTKILTLEINIKTNPEEVWDALVNPEKIKQYLFGTEAKSDWTKGSKITFEGTYDGTAYLDKGVILESLPEKKLQYSYLSSFSQLADKDENYSIITMEIESVDHSSKLILTQKGFESEENFEHSSTNWDSVLQEIKKIAEAN